MGEYVRCVKDPKGEGCNIVLNPGDKRSGGPWSECEDQGMGPSGEVEVDQRTFHLISNGTEIC